MLCRLQSSEENYTQSHKQLIWLSLFWAVWWVYLIDYLAWKQTSLWVSFRSVRQTSKRCFCSALTLWCATSSSSVLLITRGGNVGSVGLCAPWVGQAGLGKNPSELKEMWKLKGSQCFWKGTHRGGVFASRWFWQSSGETFLQVCAEGSLKLSSSR